MVIKKTGYINTKKTINVSLLLFSKDFVEKNNHTNINKQAFCKSTNLFKKKSTFYHYLQHAIPFKFTIENYVS